MDSSLLYYVSFTSFSRFIYKDTFQKEFLKSKNAKSIAIYAEDGQQLEAALRISNLIKWVFVDDDSSLWYREINGIKSIHTIL